jgi:hypothetical protein
MGKSTDGFRDERLDLVIRGGKRTYGNGTKAIRYPITSNILIRMVNEATNDEEGCNIKAALCVGFAAFLRSGEFTWDTWSTESALSCLSRMHVAFLPTSVILTLPASKTDPFRIGEDIYLAYSPHSPICPVTALKNLFQTYPKSNLSPLFVGPPGHPFSKPYFVFKMHELLLNAGISTTGYSGHSLRKGAAVTADRNGISKNDIKLLGRWKSDAVDVYINERQKPDHIQKILRLNAQLLSPLH